MNYYYVQVVKNFCKAVLLSYNKSEIHHKSEIQSYASDANNTKKVLGGMDYSTIHYISSIFLS